MFGLGLQELLILVVIFGLFALVTWPFWKIFSRAGFSGWLSLTQLGPPLGYWTLGEGIRPHAASAT